MKTLREEIERWLEEHPEATARDAIWAGAVIEINLWCKRERNR